MVKKRSVKPVKKTAYKLVGKKKPILIRIISILMYIFAIFTILLGVALFIGGVVGESVLSLETFKTAFDSFQLSPAELTTLLGSLIFAGLFIIVLGVAGLLIARGLWIGSNWSRVLTIVLMAIFFITALFSLDIITLIISGLIGGYIWFSKSAKRHFTR